MEANDLLVIVLAESPTYAGLLRVCLLFVPLTHPLKFTELCIQMSQTEHDPFYFYYATSEHVYLYLLYPT